MRRSLLELGDKFDKMELASHELYSLPSKEVKYLKSKGLMIRVAQSDEDFLKMLRIAGWCYWDYFFIGLRSLNTEKHDFEFAIGAGHTGQYSAHRRERYLEIVDMISNKKKSFIYESVFLFRNLLLEELVSVISFILGVETTGQSLEEKCESVWLEGRRSFR